MKKALALLLALGMILSLTACAGEKKISDGIRNSQPGISGAIPTARTETETQAETQPETQVETQPETTAATEPDFPEVIELGWRVSHLMDEFGYVTDKACAVSSASGTFSGRPDGDAPYDSGSLAVNVLNTPACSNADFIANFGFGLIVHGGDAVVFSSDDRIVMKVQDGNKITEEVVCGDAPSGMIYVFNSAKAPSALYAAIYNAMIRNEGEILCTIVIGSMEYCFQLSAEGFVEAANGALKEYGYDGWDVSKHPID